MIGRIRQNRLGSLQRQSVAALPGLDALHPRALVAIIDHVEDAILLVEDARVSWMNPAARSIFDGALFGIGDRLQDVVSDQRMVLLVERSVAEGIEQGAEIELAGSGRCLAIRAVPLAARVTMLLCRDASRLRYLETVRQQFVANLAHDMRTPLAGLDLAAQTLASEIGQKHKAAPLVSGVLRESQRLQAMLRNLAHLAALDAEGVQIERSAFPIRELIGELIDRHRHRAEERGLELRSCIVGEDLQVIGDRGKTEQALQNVMDNALKFTNRGEIEVGAVAKDGKVEVSVRDSGPGIPGRDLPRIFERFFKVDRSRGGHSGSGLGLSIARHLVELQGGTISAESLLGFGTTVRIRLPQA